MTLDDILNSEGESDHPVMGRLLKPSQDDFMTAFIMGCINKVLAEEFPNLLDTGTEEDASVTPI